MQPEELQRDFAPDLESFTIVAHMSIRSLANYRSIAMVDEDDDAQRGWSTTNRPAIWHLRLDWLPKSGREVGVRNNEFNCWSSRDTDRGVAIVFIDLNPYEVLS